MRTGINQSGLNEIDIARTVEHNQMATVTPDASQQEPELKIVEDATCTFCGCVCDDIELTVKGHEITKAKRACVLGKAWFLNHSVDDRPSCLIKGKPAAV